MAGLEPSLAFGNISSHGDVSRLAVGGLTSYATVVTLVRIISRVYFECAIFTRRYVARGVAWEPRYVAPSEGVAVGVLTSGCRDALGGKGTCYVGTQWVSGDVNKPH